MTDVKSLLRGLFEAGDAGNLDLFHQYLHVDVSVHAPAGLSTVGIEAERESWRKAKEAIPDLKHEFLELLTDGIIVAARCVASGTLKGQLGELSANGRRFSVDQALFARVHEGKIAELWEIVDTASLRE